MAVGGERNAGLDDEATTGKMNRFIIKRFVVPGPFQLNCYLNKKDRNKLLVVPGFQAIARAGDFTEKGSESEALGAISCGKVENQAGFAVDTHQSSGGQLQIILFTS
jgi:hypothetical protein